MTGPEDVDAALVEKAARAMADDWNPDRDPILTAMFRDYAASALAAVLPEIQAQALEAAVEHLAEVEADLDESAGLTSAMGHLGRLADRTRSEVPNA